MGFGDVYKRQVRRRKEEREELKSIIHDLTKAVTHLRVLRVMYSTLVSNSPRF